MLNEQSILDSRDLLSGKDGRLFVEDGSGNMVFMAEVNQFNIAMNVTNADYQPAGSILIYGVQTGVSFTLTFTEALLRDDIILVPLLEEIRRGYAYNFTFQGTVTRYNDEEERLIIRNCIPADTYNFMNVVPGEVIQREQSFRINNFPELQKYFETK